MAPVAVRNHALGERPVVDPRPDSPVDNATPATIVGRAGTRPPAATDEERIIDATRMGSGSTSPLRDIEVQASLRSIGDTMHKMEADGTAHRHKPAARSTAPRWLGVTNHLPAPYWTRAFLTDRRT